MDVTVGLERMQVIRSDSADRFFLALRAQAARHHAFERSLTWLRLSAGARRAE